MKIKNLAAAVVLTLLMETASAVPVVLEITFDFFPEETAFGLWETATAPTDEDIPTFFNFLGDPLLFDGPLSSNPSIPFDAATSSPFGDNGFSPVFSFFLAVPGTPYHFDWDLAIGDYTLIMFDFFADGIAAPSGYSISVGGSVVGTGSGEPFEVERTAFTAAVAVPEPGTLALFTLGLLGLGAVRRSRQ